MPAPSSIILFPATSDLPCSDVRNTPRNSAASQVRKPVVPDDARSEGASRRVTRAAFGDGVGAVYVKKIFCWAAALAESRDWDMYWAKEEERSSEISYGRKRMKYQSTHTLFLGGINQGHNDVSKAEGATAD